MNDFFIEKRVTEPYSSLKNALKAEKKLSEEDCNSNGEGEASELPAPIFDRKNTLGNEALDNMLEKKSSQLSMILDCSFKEAKEILIAKLKDNKTSNKNHINAIRFLRHFDHSSLIECPECGTENTFGWETCSNCNIKNPD